MNKSESIKELANALAKAQGEMKGAVKDSSNPFFKSKYADLASIVEAIRLPFAKNGLSYSQCIEPTEKDEVRVETMIMHSSGEWMSCGVIALPVAKSDAQGFGSAITYARRYGLAAAVGVAPEDDDGNAATKAAPAPKPESAKSISQVAWESMDEDQQILLTDISLNMIALISEDRVKEAVLYARKQDLSADEQAALNSRFDSKQRSAMKKASLELREEDSQSLAEQA
jgi:hypothetical protein